MSSGSTSSLRGRKRRRDVSLADSKSREKMVLHTNKVNDWRRASRDSESSVSRLRCSLTVPTATDQLPFSCGCHCACRRTSSCGFLFQGSVPDQLSGPIPAHLSLPSVFQGGDPLPRAPRLRTPLWGPANSTVENGLTVAVFWSFQNRKPSGLFYAMLLSTLSG